MKCIYCGKFCGLFKNEHDRCRILAEQGKKYLRECIDYIYENRDCMNIAEVIEDTVSRHNIPKAMGKKLFLECWNAKVRTAFEDGVLEADEIKILGQMVGALGIGPDELAASPQWQQLVVHGRKDISEAVDGALRSGDFSSLNGKLNAIAEAYGFSKAVTKKLFLECWENFLDRTLEENLPGETDPAELDICGKLATALEIGPDELAGSPRWQKLVTRGKIAVSAAVSAGLRSGDFSHLGERIHAVEEAYKFSPATTKRVVLGCWERFLDKVLEDQLLDRNEERTLTRLMDALALSEADFAPYRNKIVKAAILREVLNGIVPQRFKLNGPLEVVLQKNETVIWMVRNVAAYEDKVRTRLVGGSTGMSVPIGQGIYLRSSGFSAEAEETVESTRIGIGDLIITDRNIFWAASPKTIKIPAKKLVSVTPHSRGVTLLKEGATAKPIDFILDDPWFICNLTRNLNLLH